MGKVLVSSTISHLWVVHPHRASMGYPPGPPCRSSLHRWQHLHLNGFLLPAAELRKKKPVKPQNPLQSLAREHQRCAQPRDRSSSQTCCTRKMLPQIPPQLEGTIQPLTSCRVPAPKPLMFQCILARPELSPNTANAPLQGTK